jgi:predicted aspartyl protease
MGLTKVTTKLVSLTDSTKFFEAVFLVDTGATDSLAPAHELEKVGIEKTGRMSYELMGETTAGRVVFGDQACEPLLGVTALESVGIMVDPVNKTLKRLPAIPLK